MGARGPSAASIADSPHAPANRPSAAVPTRINSLAQARVAARVARSADRLQQSSPRPAIRYRLRGAETGSHSPHYALKVVIPRGAAAELRRLSRNAPRSARRHALSAVGRCLLVVLGLLAWGAGPSRAEDLERGKSGPAIF